MSTPAKTETGGWFSRLFGATSTSTGESSSTERAEPVKSPVSPGLQKRVENAKNLIKHLSPPTNGSRPMPGKSLRTLTSPASIIQRTDTRKRQHINNGEPPVLEDIFKQRSFKRFCGTANLSLAEEPIRITVPERLDMTWAGDRVDASPASSVRSLKSRLSGAASTTSSGLSSKTRAILAQLEKVHTPAREAKKLPVMRHPTVTSERWNTASAIFNTSSSAGAPPLRKTRSAVPTRLQLLSTNLGFNKTPYWKDIYRPSMKERDEAAKQKETNGQSETADELNGSRLHPIFEIPNTIPRRTTDLGRQRASKIKGSDGISRNVFNTKDLDDEDEINALPVPKTVKMPTVTAPAKGFMGTLSFQFDMPKERMSPKSNGRPESSLSRSFEQQSSSSSERSDQEESGESSSESRESSPEPPKKEEPKSSFGFAAPPAKEPTVSVTVTAPTPTTKPADTWSCSECFVQSTGEQCICCGTPKGGVSVVAPQKELFSNLSSFAPKGNSVHSFGFGTSTTAPVATPTPDVPSTDSWDCPNCFVKATGDSCSCCDYSKTGQKKLTSTFKPISSEATSGFSFGVSATSAVEKPVEKPLTASSSSPNLFGSSKPVEVTSTSTFGAPAKTDSASWSCSVCFVNSTGDSCVACGTPKDGGSSAAAPQKELVSNLSSFAPVAPVKFGFGLGSSTTPAVEKTAEPVKKVETVPATSTTPSLNGASSIFGASTAVPEPTKPLFGASSEAAKSLFGHTPLFGSTAAETKTAEAPKITFGAPATTEAAKPLFGDSSKPLFGASAPLDSSKPLFGQTDSAKPLFGTSTPLDTSKPLFGASVAAPPAVPPAKPLFSSSTAPGSIFGTTTPAAPASTTTAAPAAPSLFSGFNATPAVPAVPTFGAPAVSAFGSQEAPAAKKPMFPSLAPAADATKSATSVGSIFGQSGGNLFGQTPSAPAATGSSTNLFSQTPAPSAAPFTFGAPAAAPSFSMGGSALTGSASAGHLFTAPPAETPSSFNFGAAAAPGGQQPFVFGAPAAAAPTFSLGSSFGTAPVPASDGGMFAYSATSGGPSTSAAGRKIAQARRRIPGRK